ncbi:MAG: RnfABCDGE type electron transport complex subunit G [Synergistaceae bacterium]|jgi:electron transport complex protein RnfG|nr:RnfABCDGE type electron transport complex subunit G [Synergistaceae bacterium]
MAQNVDTVSSSGNNAKKIVRLGLVLFAVAAITGLILGVVNEITIEPIRRTQERLRNEALAAALPEAETFETVELKSDAAPIVKDVQEGKSGGFVVGYCVTAAPTGYAGPVEVVVGITSSGGVRGIRILSQSETPGLGAKAPLPKFSGQYDNKDVENLVVVKTPPSAANEIQAISGATITSNAVTLGVNTALAYWRDNLKGGN